jgi:hypothetical protein
MDLLRRGARWCSAKVVQLKGLISGDDLSEAQQHRSDDHEFKSNPLGPGAG